MTPSPAPRSFRRLVWATLGVTLLVIVWGALVRATKSGAGCGDDWPHCNGQAIPLDPSAKTLIEFTHRLTSGVVMLMALAVAVVGRKLPRGPARTLAFVSLGFMLLEAALGAALVKFRLVVDDASTARAVMMSLHLVNTMLLLGAQGLCAWFAEGAPAISLRRGGPLRTLWFGAVGLFLVLGVSGALTALGDTLFPAETLREGVAQHLDPTHVLQELRVWHPVLAISTGVLLFAWAALARRLRPGPRVDRWARVVQGLFLAQLLGGLINLVLLAPVWMQMVHLLMADLSWLSVLFLGAATLAEPEDAALPARSGPALAA